MSQKLKKNFSGRQTHLRGRAVRKMSGLVKMVNRPTRARCPEPIGKEPKESLMSLQLLDARPQFHLFSHPEHDNVTAQTKSEHDELIAAVRALEDKLSIAAPGRERCWARQVVAEMRRL